jgi:hypothetical protein
MIMSKKKNLARVISFICSVTVLMAFLVIFPNAASALSISKDLALNGDFETPLGDEWEAKWSTINIDTTESQSGSSSLAITDREAFYAGPSQAISLKGGVTYTLSCYVKLPADTPATKIILAFNDAAGNNQTDWDYMAVAVSDEWRQITGTYTPEADLTGTINFLTYNDSDNSPSTAAFYLDNYSLTYLEEYPIPKGDNILRNGDFEEPLKDTDDPLDPELTWSPRDLSWAVLKIDDQVKKSGNSSLFVTDRLAFWSGANQSIDLVGGKEYYASGWVYVDEDALYGEMGRIILCFNDDMGNNLSEWDISGDVIPGQWSKIEGIFTPEKDYTGATVSFMTYDIINDSYAAADYDYYLDEMFITYEGYEQLDEPAPESDSETVEEEQEEQIPKTGDSSMLYLALLMVASLTIFIKVRK